MNPNSKFFNPEEYSRNKSHKTRIGPNSKSMFLKDVFNEQPCSSA